MDNPNHNWANEVRNEIILHILMLRTAYQADLIGSLKLSLWLAPNHMRKLHNNQALAFYLTTPSGFQLHVIPSDALIQAISHEIFE